MERILLVVHIYRMQSYCLIMVDPVSIFVLYSG